MSDRAGKFYLRMVQEQGQVHRSGNSSSKWPIARGWTPGHYSRSRPLTSLHQFAVFP